MPLAISSGEVILIVTLISVPIAAIAFAGAGAAYRQIGKGAFSIDHDLAADGLSDSSAGLSAGLDEDLTGEVAGTGEGTPEGGEGAAGRGGQAAEIAAGTGRAGGASLGTREEEIRQLLEAKAYRQVSRGEEPLNVDSELHRLLDHVSVPGADPALAEEVRQLVVARNERRMRRGEPPLDVRAEVERQLRELESLGQ